MAELIDRTALFADIDEAIVFSGRIGTNAEMRGANKIVDRIKAAKAVDAVPVVRCKDCKHSRYYGFGEYTCLLRELNEVPVVNAEHFCSYGERKET